MIRDTSGNTKDYAFAEFYTADEAKMIVERSKQEPFKVKGQQVYVSYARLNVSNTQ